MGPGPSDVPERVLAALAQPTIGHLDPAFVAMMDELKGLLQFAFQTSNALTLPVSAPGSAGMETCFVNLIGPGDTVIVAQNGVFGGRMLENVERCGALAILVEDEWGQPVDPNKVEDALRAHQEASIVAFVHAETSTGARSDARALCALAAHHDCLSIVDTVTSLGGIDVDADGWGADAMYSGTQKCLSCVPGIAPVTFGDRAVERIRNREYKAQSWFLDLDLVMGYWGDNAKRTYHHTAPVNTLYALHEALLILHEEGLKNAWQRHAHHHRALVAGLEALGMKLVVEPEWRLPQLNTVRIPDGLDDAVIRARLLNEYDLEIGAGLGPLAGQVWRIGLMGYSCRRDNVLLCLNALGRILSEADGTLNASAGTEAAEQMYSSA